MFDLAVFFLYLAALVAYGIRRSIGVNTLDDFLVANRNLGFWVLTGTLVMTEFNPSTMVWMTGLGYLGGVSSVLLAGIFIVGLGLYTVLVARRWKRLNVTSLAELFERRYGRGMRLAASLMILFALSLFSVGYLKATANVFSAALGMDEAMIAVLLCVSVLAVTVMGGLTSVAWTDLFSFFVAVAMIPVLFGTAWFESGGWGALREAYPDSAFAFDPAGTWDTGPVPFRLILTVYFIIAWVYMLAPWYAQRMFAARDESVAYRSMALSTVLVTVLYAMVLLTGSLYHTVNPDLGGEAGADRVLGLAVDVWMPVGLKGLFLATVFAICQTTMSSIWNTHVAMTTEDIYRGLLRRNASERERFIFARVLTVVLAVFTLLAVFGFDATVREINFLGNIFFASLFFAGIGGFVWSRPGPVSAWTTLLVANVTGVGLYLWGRYEPSWLPVMEAGWDYHFYVRAMPLILFLGILIALLEPRREAMEAKKAAFYRQVGRPWA